MFAFTVLIRVFCNGREIRDRKDIRSSTAVGAHAARRSWIAEGHKVSPVVRITGGAK